MKEKLEMDIVKLYTENRLLREILGKKLELNLLPEDDWE